ncbi:MAG: ABC transporter substrate-binding protein [Lachnospiraceae bacterium]|nr:ABC transporter substrate-binding protein [Lachnospiraceae bacterium]
MKKLCSILTLIIIIISTSCKYQVQNNNLVTITDMLGDTITIPKNPQRVACVSRTTYDLLVAFGLSDKIDGAYKNIYDNPWLETVYPNSKNEYRYEYEENYETFLTRKIDLVFAPEKYISDNLKAHGINSLCISLYGNPTYDDYLFFFADMIMNIWDDKEVHKKVLTWKQDVIDAIEKCSNSNDNRIEYKKLFYVRGDKNKGIEYTDTKGSFTEFAFRKLGFDYAGKFFNTTKPSKEEICKYNPDVFVIGGIFQNILKEKLKNDDIYKDLDAVKNNNIYQIPFGLTSFEQLSITTPIFFYDMSNILNNTNFNVSNMIKSTFKEYFNVDLTEKQIGYMLEGKGPNGRSISNEQ